MTTNGPPVLVVDDDKTSRLLLSRLLEHEGYEPHEAVDGTEALAVLDTAPFEAVLLDLVMPGMDGTQVLQLIKGTRGMWDVPVIMISSVEETDSIARCLELGAEDYLPKPFDPVLLRARMNAALARKRFRDLETQYRRVVKAQADELARVNRELTSRVEELERIVNDRRLR
jgi:DNA-binding response OmpR family regulator